MLALLKTMSPLTVARDDLEVVLDSAPNHKPGLIKLMATVSGAPGAGRFKSDAKYRWLVSGSLRMKVENVSPMTQEQDSLLIEARPLTPLEELDEELGRRLGRRPPLDLESPVYAPLKAAMALPTSTTMRAMVFCLIHDFQVRELDIRYEPWKIKIHAQLKDADGATTDFYSENIHDLYLIQRLEYVRAGGRDLIRGID
jgi:hypothetical protein